MYTYILTDGNSHETFRSFSECRAAMAEWYNYLLGLTDETRRVAFHKVLRETNLVSVIQDAFEFVELVEAVDRLEYALAEAAGHEDVREAGFRLRVEMRIE